MRTKAALVTGLLVGGLGGIFSAHHNANDQESGDLQRHHGGKITRITPPLRTNVAPTAPAPRHPQRQAKPQAQQQPAQAAFNHILTNEFMERVAFSESSLDSHAYNPKSGALGKFQFTPNTFLEQLYKHGESIGYGHLSRHITRTILRNDRNQQIGEEYVVADPRMERVVLNARTDEKLSRKLARLYIREGLERIDGRVDGFEEIVNPAIAYKVLHFGANGAYKAVTALQEKPDTPFVEIIGRSTCARNRAICYTRGNQPRSVAQVADLLEQRLENAPVQHMAITKR